MSSNRFCWDPKESPKVLEKVAKVLKKEGKPMLISEIANKTRMSHKQIYQNINIPRARTFGIIEEKDNRTKWKLYAYKPLNVAKDK